MKISLAFLLTILAAALGESAQAQTSTCNQTMEVNRNAIFAGNNLLDGGPNYQSFQPLKDLFVGAECTSDTVQQWMREFDYVCQIPIKKQLTTSSVEDVAEAEKKLNQQWLELQQHNAETTLTCYQSLLKGLNIEKSIREESGQENLPTTIAEDVAVVTKAIQQQEKLLGQVKEKQTADNKTMEKRLEEYLQNKNRAEMYTTEFWLASFLLGVRMMPEYNEEGENQGFKESNYFGSIRWDARGEAAEVPFFNKQMPYHFGANVRFLSQPVVNCSDDNSTTQQCTDPDLPIDDLKFNDVANALEASVYGWLHFKQWGGGKSELGIGVREGFQSREQLTENGDSVNRFQTYGLRYVHNDFINKNHGDNGEAYKNGAPRFYIEVSKAKYEDFAGTDNDVDRTIVSAAYRILDDAPVFIGLSINGGEGPDEISLSLSYGFKMEKLFGLF